MWSGIYVNYGHTHVHVIYRTKFTELMIFFFLGSYTGFIIFKVLRFIQTGKVLKTFTKKDTHSVLMSVNMFNRHYSLTDPYSWRWLINFSHIFVFSL